MPGIEAKSDAEYQAEWDAQTLAQANQIKADASRNAAAEGAAKKLADEQKDQAVAMQKVAKGVTQRAPRNQTVTVADNNGTWFQDQMKR